MANTHIQEPFVCQIGRKPCSARGAHARMHSSTVNCSLVMGSEAHADRVRRTARSQ